MKMYCISDNIETAVGLKLTGVDAVVLQEKSDVDEEIEKILKDNEIGVLVVTEKIYEMSQKRLNEIKEKLKTPLLVKI